MDAKKTWFFLNLFFMANYGLRLLKLAVRLPVPVLPNYVNCLALAGIYSLTLAGVYRDLRKLVTNQNFLCIGLFLTFPHCALLAPFFLLSIYHANSYVLSNKKKFSSAPFFGACLALGPHSVQLGRAAMYLEFGSIPLAFCMLFTRACSVKTFVAYYAIVRQQYIHNAVMRSIVHNTLLRVDAQAQRLPAGARALYQRAAGCFCRLHGVPVDAAKKNE